MRQPPVAFQRRRIQRAGRKPAGGDVGGPPGALQRVLDSFAVERVDQPGGVAEQHHAVADQRQPGIVGGQRAAEDLSVHPGAPEPVLHRGVPGDQPQQQRRCSVGAHAPGQLRDDIPLLGGDQWIGNLHKCAYTPRGSAILWSRPGAEVMPTVLSWQLDDGYAASFDYPGTWDYAGWLAVADGLAYWAALGGWDAVSRLADLVT